MLLQAKWNEIATGWINARKYIILTKKIQFPLDQENTAAYSIKAHDSNTIWANEVVSSIPARNLFYLSVATSFISQDSLLDNFYLNCIISFLILFCGQDWRESRKNKMQLVTDYTTEKESVSTCLHKWSLFVYIVTSVFDIINDVIHIWFYIQG